MSQTQALVLWLSNFITVLTYCVTITGQGHSSRNPIKSV